MALAFLPFLGCGQKTPPPSPVVVQNTAPLAGIAANTNSTAVELPDVDESEAAPEGESLENAPAQIVAPAEIPAENLSRAAAEIVKLAQAGLDEAVMMAFVTNSTNTFRLSSDNLVYLNDIGVPGTVITAMIQRDQAAGISTSEAETVMPAAAPTNQPTYVAGAPTPYSMEAPAATAPVDVPSAPVIQAPAESQVNVAYTYFYDSLAPYGSWINVQGYGLCWRPTAVAADPGWQPYLHRGRWLYTDAGWYWASDYTWGWAPFHYGRWFRHSNWGWCWAPDTVWGPSWVSWRYTPDYCGWAPLPPSAYYRPGYGFSYYGRSVGIGFGFGLSANYYCFVPTRNFHGRHIHHHRLPHHRERELYRHTRPLQRYDRDERNRVVNRGIPVEHVRAASRSDIRPIPIRETDRPTPARLERQRDNTPRLAVYRPEMPQPERNGRLVGEGIRPAPIRIQPRTVDNPRGEGAVPTPARTGREAGRGPARDGNGNGAANAVPRNAVRTRDISPRERPQVADTPAPAGSVTTPVRVAPQGRDGQVSNLRGNNRPENPIAAPPPPTQAVQPSVTPNQPTERTVVRPRNPGWAARTATPQPASPSATPGPTPTPTVQPRPQTQAERGVSPQANPLPRMNPGAASPQPGPTRQAPMVRQLQSAPAPAPAPNPVHNQGPAIRRSVSQPAVTPRAFNPAPAPTPAPRQEIRTAPRVMEQPRAVSPRMEVPAPRVSPPPQMQLAPRQVVTPQPRPSPQPRQAPQTQPGNRGEGRRNR